MEIQNFPCSRRSLVRFGSLAMLAGANGMVFGGPAFAQAAMRSQVTISDLQTMLIQGPGRTYVYVKVTADNGQFGIGEAYGSPGVGVSEQILSMKPQLVGKNPLEIDKIYTTLDEGAKSLAGPRTDGSAHMLIRAASGIEMALWDLAGKVLDVPLSVLMGGRFRDHVRMYDHSRPENALDKTSCREWANKVRADPAGFTAHKIGIFRTDSIWDANGVNPDNGKDPGNRFMTTQEIRRLGEGFANMREAIGWDQDLMVHCHWELDLTSAIRLAEAVAPSKPLWLEDPLMVDYNDSWKQLAMRSPVPIHTGENLARREGFMPFITNQATHFVNPDLRNSGGFLETKRIADIAAIYGIPMTTHNTASQLHTYQVAQWASSIRDYVIGETVTGRGDWMDQVLELDGSYIEHGYIKVSDRPGTGAVLNRDVVEPNLAPGETWWN